MFHLKPRWIVFGGCWLAFLSAAVNAGFLIQLGTSVSHLTGDVAKAASDLVSQSSQTTFHAHYLIIATFGFVTGATAAGYSIHHPEVELSRPYGRAVTTIGLVILGAHWTLNTFPAIAVALASFSCGFQNALATHYRGMILRTTHLTGLLTDLGTNLGMRLKGHRIASWKLVVPSCLLVSFFVGALFGSLLILQWRNHFLLVLAILYLTGGIGWSLLKRVIMIKHSQGLQMEDRSGDQNNPRARDRE